MFIEQLDKTRLLITLEHDDLDVFDLEPYSISMEDKETKSLFKHILTLAAIKAGITIKNKKLSVETMPYDSGCFLLVTIKPKDSRKIYRMKKNTSHLIVKFNCVSSMLDALQRLYRQGYLTYRCSAYSKCGCYYLLFSSKALFPREMTVILSEYGKISKTGDLETFSFAEQCKPIILDTAIISIGSKL